MSVPGIIKSTAQGLFARALAFTTDFEIGHSPSSNNGVFSKTPGATPKYAINRGRRDAEKRDTLARLFINMPASRIQAFRATLTPRTQPLADVLLSGAAYGGGGGNGFIDFLLTQANENMQEKTQIVDTLTDNYVAFYSGQEPPVFDYSGVLLNTYQDDQRVWMLQLYREILRGSRLAGNNLIVNLRYDSFIVSGYMEALQLGLRGDDVDSSSFRFSLRVKRMSVFTPALGLPAVVEGAPSDKTIVQGRSPDTQRNTQRATSLTSGKPATPSASPAADPKVFTAQEDAEGIAGLVAGGLEPETAKTQWEAMKSEGQSVDVNSSQLKSDVESEGADRYREEIVPTQAQVSGPSPAEPFTPVEEVPATTAPIASVPASPIPVTEISSQPVPPSDTITIDLTTGEEVGANPVAATNDGDTGSNFYGDLTPFLKPDTPASSPGSSDPLDTSDLDDLGGRSIDELLEGGLPKGDVAPRERGTPRSSSSP